MDLLQHTPGPNENLQRGMAEVSLDRRRCAVFTRSNFWIVDVATGKVRKTVPLPPAPNGQRLDARLLAFNPSGSRLVAGVTGGGHGPTLYCYDTANGKLVSTTTNLAARDDRLDLYRLGWFGEEHIFLCRHDGDHRLYRAEDGAAIATMRHQFGHGRNILHAPDGRLWYCPNSNGNATLIGVSFPAALRGAAPAQPYALTLGPDGLLGSVPAVAAPAAPAPQDAAVFPQAPVEPDPAPPIQRGCLVQLGSESDAGQGSAGPRLRRGIPRRQALLHRERHDGPADERAGWQAAGQLRRGRRPHPRPGRRAPTASGSRPRTRASR